MSLDEMDWLNDRRDRLNLIKQILKKNKFYKLLDL